MTEPRWLDEREQHLWQAYLQVNRQLFAALEDQMVRDAGLSGADFTVLHPLSETPEGALRARELCTEIGWDRSRLSHHVTRMERRGLVAREECVEDGRGLVVRLTDAGRAAIEIAGPHHVAAVRLLFFDVISERELHSLTTFFDHVLENLSMLTSVPRTRSESF